MVRNLEKRLVFPQSEFYYPTLHIPVKQMVQIHNKNRKIRSDSRGGHFNQMAYDQVYSAQNHKVITVDSTAKIRPNSQPTIILPPPCYQDFLGSNGWEINFHRVSNSNSKHD